MWITVLVMAIMVSLRPVSIGLTAMILNGPRPMQQLLAFLCGAFAMGTSVGLVVLFILRHTLLATTNFTVPKVQIVIGLLALLVAAVLATNIWARQFTRGPLARADGRRPCWCGLRRADAAECPGEAVHTRATSFAG